MHMLFVTYRWQFQILLYLIYLFYLGRLFTAAHRLLYCDVQALQHMGSVAEHMLSCGVWDLSSPTRDWTQAPCIGSAES